MKKMLKHFPVIQLHYEGPLGTLIEFLYVEFSMFFCLGNIEHFFAQFCLTRALKEQLKSFFTFIIAG